MIPPRLTQQRVVSEAQLLDPKDVFEGDPRLVHLNEAFCRELVATNPYMRFVTWPDGALGMVAQPTGNESLCNALMCWAYLEAREALEFLVLYLSSPEAVNQTWS